MDSTSQRLAAYVADISFAELDDDVVDRTAEVVLDTVGCAIGGFTSPPAKALREEYAAHSGGDPARIAGTDRTVPVEYAALINATMARYLDYNDCYMGPDGACHPSDHVLALMAVAEAEGATGAELVEAVVTAYEVQCLGMDQAPVRAQGFDYVAWGAYSSAAAVGKLMGLDGDDLVNAIGIAGTANAPLYVGRRDSVSMWKGVAHPYVTHNAIQACQMARAGMTGPAEVFDGTFGFREVVSPNELTFGDPPAGDGYRIMETGIKYYACGYYIHSAVTAVLELRAEYAFDPTDVESIHVDTFDHAATVLATPDKWSTTQNRETADHSIPYTVAAALVDGEVTPRQYATDRLRDPAIHRAMETVTVDADPALTAHRESNPKHIPARVTIGVDGAEYTARVDAPLGHAERPMSDAQFDEKFRSLCDGLLGDEAVDDAIERSRNVHRLETVDTLLDALVI
ncbi:MmgE/PrpD family protein [Halorubrum sp. DTA46]|uniref:MmgE/PrpD family protein n=1 Tax=Halorubrum sp. DTA46 TaxID=3402162 RepID=UPI003AAAB75F